MTIHPEFPTPEMRAAERELDGRIDVALARARELQETMDRLDKEEAEAATANSEPEPLPGPDELRELVTDRALTPEWRQVIDRIDRGTLSWDEVLSTLRSGTADPEVTAAFQSLASVPFDEADESADDSGESGAPHA